MENKGGPGTEQNYPLFLGHTGGRNITDNKNIACILSSDKIVKGLLRTNQEL